MLTDSTGATTYTAHYDPYGAPIDMTGSSSTSFGFTGEQTDSNDLQYLRARYYDPSLGVFVAKDPVWGISGMSQSMNGYSYVHGNPINMVDPSGLCAEGLRGAACRDLARRLHRRLGGNLEDYYAQSYGTLILAWTTAGFSRHTDPLTVGMHRALIFNRLLEENPDVATRALLEVLDDCGDSDSLALAATLQMGRKPDPRLLIGVLGAISAVAFLQLISRIDEWAYSGNVVYSDSSDGSPEREYRERKPGQSGKEAAKDIPSWAKGERPYKGENGNQFAKRLLGYVDISP